MSTDTFDLSSRFTEARGREFAAWLQDIQTGIDFRCSARGWAYLLEQKGLITKDRFDQCEAWVNKCRKRGLLPVDFVASEAARDFAGVEIPSTGHPADTLNWMLSDVLDGYTYFKPDWWADQKFYVQMIVEKVDLVSLFEPVCREYHIPIANCKGWSSILQRATFSQRFKAAEERGLQCVLLYCGDHDPAGLQISSALRSNIAELSCVQWQSGEAGYDPANLEIIRFGLNYDFIQDQGYTWIDNLITSRKNSDGQPRNLADPKHSDHKKPYVQSYIKQYGARKCEANVLVTTPEVARDLCREVIEGIVGSDALERYASLEDTIKTMYMAELDLCGLAGPIKEFLGEE